MSIFKCMTQGSRIRVYLFGKLILSLHRKIPHSRIQANYTAKLEELKKRYARKEKIRVGFLVNEPAKWQYQSLFDELNDSDIFEPVVLLSKMTGYHPYHKSFQDLRDFFSKLGLAAESVYDEKADKYFPLSKAHVDIVFYSDPNAMPFIQHPVKVSEYALTCYVPYGMHLVMFDGSYREEFHKTLWKMFIENKYILDDLEFLTKNTITNCENVGYSKLDAYHCTPPKSISEKIAIIYAPHHSFEKHGLSCATFETTGVEMLNLARMYKNEIFWIFKPHPRFKHALIRNGIMTEQEVEDYYKAWADLGLVYDSGNYIGLFQSSSALVTDCLSFLGEYLPSGHPVFRLDSGSDPFGSFGRKIINTYYQIKTVEEFKPLFKRVVINKDDFKKNERIANIPLVFDKNIKTSSKIIEILFKYIR